MKENEKLAELVGIILGDGHLHKKGELSYKDSLISISLNRIDDKEYVLYVEQLLITIFNKKPRSHNRKGTKGIDLKLSGEDIIDNLISMGLQTGDKVKNQVGVPRWIYSKPEYRRSCLKGLLDTDGSIFINRRDKRLGIIFKNSSKPLVEDFKELCESFDIKMGKIIETESKSRTTDTRTKAYHTQIQAKSQVKKFIDLVKPMKWKFNRQKIIASLNELDITIEDALRSRYKK